MMLRVELGVPQMFLRRWQVELARRLDSLPGVSVGTRWSKQLDDQLPPCIGTLLSLERVLNGVRADLTAPATPTDLFAYVGTGGVDPDLVIDLGGGHPSAGQRRWRLTFDGEAGDGPILAALLARRAPVISVSEVVGGRIVAEARPGLPVGDTVAQGFEAIVARAISLVLTAVGGGGAPLRLQTLPSRLSCNAAVGRATRALADAALARLSLATKEPTRARTGWRFVSGPDVVDLGTHPACGWQVLPDDGRRCYSHPFPIMRNSEPWLFLTERDAHLGKSLISVVKFGPTGPLGTPSPILDLTGDLSNSLVFEAEGNVWMIPESSDSNAIDLYRASRFPGGWRHEARLVENVRAGSPTPFRHNGRWWISATVRDADGPEDMLHLWSARQLRGPWRAFPHNPVLIDAATAASAGRVVERAGRLIRPVRDRRKGRSGLALAEIIHLDEDTFEQRILAEIAPGGLWPTRSISTLNRAGAIECIGGTDFPVAATAPAETERAANGQLRQPAAALGAH